MMAVHHGGQEFPIEMSLAAWREGRLVRLRCQHPRHFGRNAAKAEMRRQQAASRRPKRRPKRRGQAKSEFLANMSHELRTPSLRILGTPTSCSLTTSSARSKSGTYSASRAGGTALLAVVNDVLCYSNIETGQVVLRLQPFSVR